MKHWASAMAALAVAGAALAADVGPNAPRYSLRGTVIVEKDVPTFRSCGPNGRQFFLVDATGGELGKAYGELASSPGAPVFMELRGVVLQGSATGPGAGFERLLRAESVEVAERTGPGCRAAVGRLEARALGSSPAWQIELARAGVTFASLEQPGMLIFPAYGAAWPHGTELRYSASSDAGTLALTLRPERCRDAASGNFYALSALAVLNGQEYRGCAFRGRPAVRMTSPGR